MRPFILIVEDDRATQLVLSECLRPQWRTVSAFDGDEGLRRALELRPDLIITDIRMPKMDGEQLIRAVRAAAQLDGIPIMVITALADRLHTVQLLELGAQDVLHKPVLFPEVRARVATLLDAKRTREILMRMVGRQEVELVRLAELIEERTRSLEMALDELRTARREADSAARSKSNFLRMMSHELKTPITAMQLHLHVLQREAEHAGGYLMHSVTRIMRSNHRLAHLIDTCMEWARVESGRCRPHNERFDLADAVDRVVASLASLAHDASIAIEVTSEIGSHAGDTWLTGDRRIVDLVLYNLISHAVQVSHPGVVTIETSSAPDVRRVTVTDCGPVLSPHDCAVALAPLQSDDKPESAAGWGSGLALYVIRDIAQAIGGDVALAASGTSGNTYTLTLSDRTPVEAVATSDELASGGPMATSPAG